MTPSYFAHPAKKPKATRMRRQRFPPWVYAAIVAEQGGLCGCGCDEPLGADPRNIHWDHMLPLWCGGADAPDNLAALIVRHHLDKTRGEAKALAKSRRLVAGGSHRRRNLNATERELAKLLEGR